MRIAIVQGTRPEIIKNYAIVKALEKANIPHEVLHTNQHSDPSMCGSIYADMGYGLSRKMSEPYRLGAAIDWLQRTFKRDNISHVIVNGDTAAALEGALAAMYMDLDVTHIEAGLRSRDKFMYEERNRIIVDAVASLLFAYTEHEQRLLQDAPDIYGEVYCDGNTTVDVLQDFAGKISQRIFDGDYLYVTMHRKEFTDSGERMRKIFAILRSIAEHRCAVVFPMHPRTVNAMHRWGINQSILGPVLNIAPVAPFDSLSFAKYAKAVLTDSGCLQEEAYMLGVPCVTIRNNTERHLTVRNGANVVTGFRRSSILRAVDWACDARHPAWPEIYGASGAGERIVNRIVGYGQVNYAAVERAQAS